MKSDIGLKNFSRKYKGASLRFQIHSLFKELRWAWQRAWRGYDDSEVWNFDSYFMDRTVQILETYNKTRHCLWYVPVESEYYNELGKTDPASGIKVFNNEETGILIDTMIFHLKMSNPDYVEERLYDGEALNNEEIKRVHKIAEQNKDSFMELFRLFFYQLWD